MKKNENEVAIRDDVYFAEPMLLSLYPGAFLLLSVRGYEGKPIFDMQHLRFESAQAFTGGKAGLLLIANVSDNGNVLHPKRVNRSLQASMELTNYQLKRLLLAFENYRFKKGDSIFVYLDLNPKKVSIDNITDDVIDTIANKIEKGFWSRFVEVGSFGKTEDLAERMGQHYGKYFGKNFRNFNITVFCKEHLIKIAQKVAPKVYDAFILQKNA